MSPVTCEPCIVVGRWDCAHGYLWPYEILTTFPVGVLSNLSNRSIVEKVEQCYLHCRARWQGLALNSLLSIDTEFYLTSFSFHFCPCSQRYFNNSRSSLIRSSSLSFVSILPVSLLIKKKKKRAFFQVKISRHTSLDRNSSLVWITMLFLNNQLVFVLWKLNCVTNQSSLVELAFRKVRTKFMNFLLQVLVLYHGHFCINPMFG